MTPHDQPQPADVLLSDGTIATIRPLRTEDAADLYRLHEAVSDTSSRLRFFSANRLVGHAYAAHLLGDRSGATLALVAVRHGELVGLASAEIDGPSAEVSFLVADALHGFGLGTLLLEHLAAQARSRGIRAFTAEVLTENAAMIQVFTDAGFDVRKTQLGTSATWRISTEPADRAQSAADHRERIAETRSLRPLLYPRSVAVVGVRRDGQGIGNAILRSISTGGFAGRVSVVHPVVDVEGHATYRRMTDVPDHVDVAVVAVPAERAPAAVADAAAAGVSVAVVVSSGFSELGTAGAALQQEILTIARTHDMRVVGPNCLGLLCNDAGSTLNATFSSAVPPPGSLALASQSGGVGIAVLDQARRLGVGVHSFVSLGNQPDVTASDLVATWQDDPNVSAGALYLESFGNPRKFARLARRFSEQKPLLAVAGGRSAGGARGGASHTAAAATPGVGIDALFTQTGIIACRTASELVHAARLLTEQPLPQGRRVAVVSNAGGIAILAADAADDLGLAVPELSADLQQRIRHHLASTIGVRNPIDLGAAAAPEDLEAVLDVLLEADEVDAVLVGIVPTTAGDPMPHVDAVARARTRNADLPVLLVAMGGLEVPPGRAPGVTVFASTEDALTALRRAVRYADWRADARDGAGSLDQDRAETARKLARHLASGRGHDGTWLAPQLQAPLLAPYGLDVVGDVVVGRLPAARAAERIGFPVAVKVVDPAVVHKTDRGLVRVGLTTTSQVLDAVDAFDRELGQRSTPVLVQPVLNGVELALGVVRHPSFGPLVMVAAGGVATEVWQDRTFLMPPITRQDATRALRALRIWPLLEGYRGTERVDVDALERLVTDLAQLAQDVPEIAELDVNPVLATPSGAEVVDVKVRLRAVADQGVFGDRQLTAACPTGPDAGD